MRRGGLAPMDMHWRLTRELVRSGLVTPETERIEVPAPAPLELPATAPVPAPPPGVPVEPAEVPA